MSDGKVVLDKRAFKALASETRIDVLKLLDARRMTQTELARSLALKVQSVSEHLGQLEEAGLVKRSNEGRKWVYYELSESGLAILHPERKAFWVLLGVSALMLAFSFFNLFAQKSALAAQGAGVLSQESAPMMAAKGAEAAGDAFTQTAMQAPVVAQGLLLSPLDFLLLFAGALLFGASLTYLFAKRRQLTVAVVLGVLSLGAFALFFQ